MKRTWMIPLAAGLVMGGSISCGSGSSPAGSTPIIPPVTPPTAQAGFTMPSELSPVATTISTGNSIQSLVLAAPRTKVLASATDAGTDYANARTTRYISEHSLDQISTIETILSAVAQTHYADVENVNAGPYKCIIAWKEKQQGSQGKSTQTWIVDSAMIQVDGTDVNRLRAWIDDGGRIIKAEFMIYASAVRRADGSYLNYGQWDLAVKFDEAGTSYFMAKASIGASGESIIAVNNSEMHESQEIRKAVMHKSDASGYGKVYFPLWNGNAPTQTTASYVYNAPQLRVKHGASDVYKDRAASVEITQNYGVFDSDTGQDVTKSHSFGFPVSYQLNGATAGAYYGSWQGRHQLWSGQGTIPDGTLVTRQDRGNSAETYRTVSFNGTLTKRTLVAADISDLLNIPQETWVNFQHQLQWSGSQWTENGAAFTNFGSLGAQPRKSVFINRWDNTLHQPMNYVYDPAGPSGAGFYVASMSGGEWTSTGQIYVPSASDMLWININGSIYLEYLGAGLGWVQKTVTAFDQQTWTPTFDPSGDHPYLLPLNAQYYFSNQGANYVVTRTGAGVFDVKIEIQSAANPANAAGLLSGVTLLKPQNFNPAAPAQTSTFQFVTDPSSPAFLKLIYVSVGSQDANLNPAPHVGDALSSGQWGLKAYDAGDANLGVHYNWDYPQSGGMNGIQTFLYTDAGGVRTYKLLDDPIQLAPLVLSVNGLPKTVSLQFDGWMHGIPSYDQELARNDWTITEDVAGKIINIPEGTAATSALDGTKSYLIKPLDIGVYLKLAATPDPALDITSADAIDLDDATVVPSFVDNALGAMPAISAVKYSEGVLVQ